MLIIVDTRPVPLPAHVFQVLGILEHVVEILEKVSDALNDQAGMFQAPEECCGDRRTGGSIADSRLLEPIVPEVSGRGGQLTRGFSSPREEVPGVFVGRSPPRCRSQRVNQVERVIGNIAVKVGVICIESDRIFTQETAHLRVVVASTQKVEPRGGIKLAAIEEVSIFDQRIGPRYNSTESGIPDVICQLPLSRRQVPGGPLPVVEMPVYVPSSVFLRQDLVNLRPMKVSHIGHRSLTISHSVRIEKLHPDIQTIVNEIPNLAGLPGPGRLVNRLRYPSIETIIGVADSLHQHTRPIREPNFCQPVAMIPDILPNCTRRDLGVAHEVSFCVVLVGRRSIRDQAIVVSSLIVRPVIA